MDIGIATLPPDASDIDQPLSDIILDILRMEPGQMRLTPESNLYELGLESLNVVELLTRIEMRFDIIIDVEDLSADLFRTYGSMLAFVAGKRAEGA